MKHTRLYKIMFAASLPYPTYTHVHTDKRLCSTLFQLTDWLSWHTNKITNTHAHPTHTNTHIPTRLMMVLNVSHTRPCFSFSFLIVTLFVYVYVCAYTSLCLWACELVCVCFLSYYYEDHILPVKGETFLLECKAVLFNVWLWLSVNQMYVCVYVCVHL